MSRKCATCDAEAMPGETMCYTCEWALTIRTNSLVREVEQVCACGHPLANHCEAGCLGHKSQTPLEYCECSVTGFSKCGHPVGAMRDVDGHMICSMCFLGMA